MINNAVCPCVSAVVLYKSHSTVTELVKLNETVRNYSWFSLPLNIKKKKTKKGKSHYIQFRCSDSDSS